MRGIYSRIIVAACLVATVTCAVVKRDNSFNEVELPGVEPVHSHAGAFAKDIEGIVTFGGTNNQGQVTKKLLTLKKSSDSSGGTGGSSSGGGTGGSTGGSTSGEDGDSAAAPSFEVDDNSLVEVGTSNDVCPLDAPHRCEDQNCVKFPSDCKLPNGCAAGTPVLCEDKSCVTVPTECPSGKEAAAGEVAVNCQDPTPRQCLDGKCYPNDWVCCPATRPIKCPDGTCTADRCEGVAVVECPTGEFPCPDGACVKDVQLCSNSAGTSVPTTACPTTEPHRCPDGRCVLNEAGCVNADGSFGTPGTPTTVNCPAPKVFCPDGQCHDKCPDGSAGVPGGGTATSCNPPKILCPDGICHDICPTTTGGGGGTPGGVTCNAPKILCPDGQCHDICPTTSGGGATPGGGTATNCDPPKLICPDGQCLDVCPNTGGGGTATTCNAPKQICPDGQCLDVCPNTGGGGTATTCNAPKQICPDGQCLDVCPNTGGGGGTTTSCDPPKLICPDGQCHDICPSTGGGGGSVDCPPPKVICADGQCKDSCANRRLLSVVDGAGGIGTMQEHIHEEVAQASLAHRQRIQQSASAVPSLSRHALTEVGSILFIYGGENNGVITDDIYYLTTESTGSVSGSKVSYKITKASTPSVRPPPRADHTICTGTAVNGDQTIYVFGGRDSSGGLLGDLWEYNIANPDAQFVRNTSLANGIHLPSPRYGHSTGVWSTRGGSTLGVFVYGGTDGTDYFDDLWDVLNHRQIKYAAGPSPPARAFHAGTMFGHMYVIYGGQTQDGSGLSDLWTTAFGGSNSTDGLVWEALPPGEDDDGNPKSFPVRYKMAFLKDSGRLQIQGGMSTSNSSGSTQPVAVSSMVQFNLACPPGMYSDPEFDSNCYPCPKGMYSPNVGASACVPCPLGTYADQEGQGACTQCPTFELATTKEIGSTTVDNCQCVDIIAYGATGGECTACPVGATCSGTTITAIPEYYQSPNDNTLLWRCNPPDACLGENSCATGYTGVRCSSCQRNPSYYKLNMRCEKCPETSRPLIVTVIVMVFFSFCVVLYQISEGGDSMSTVSISLQYFQLQGILSGFEVDWPESIRKALEYFTILNFNLDLTSPECTTSMDFFDKFSLFMTLPIIFALLFGCIMGLVWAQSVIMTKLKGPRPNLDDMTVEERDAWDDVKWWRHMWSRPADPEEFSNRTCNAFCLLVLLVYVPVLAKIFQYFDCTTNLDGSVTLDAEVTHTCWAGRHQTFLPLAITALLIYGAGIPGVFMYILSRKKFFDPVFLARFGTLYDKYDRQYYYWELVNLLRKVLIVACSIFFTELVFGQLIVAMFIAFGILVWQSFAEPYREHKDNRLDFTLMLCNFLLLFAGFLFFADVFNCVKREKPREKGKLCLFPSEESKEVFAWILVTLIIITLVAIVSLFVYDLYRWNQRRKKTASEREAEERMPPETREVTEAYFFPFAVDFVDRWYQYQGLKNRKSLLHLLAELEKSASDLAVANKKGIPMFSKRTEIAAESGRMGGTGPNKYKVTPAGPPVDMIDPSEPPVKPPNPYGNQPDAAKKAGSSNSSSKHSSPRTTPAVKPATEDGVMKEAAMEADVLAREEARMKERQELDLQEKLAERRKERELRAAMDVAKAKEVEVGNTVDDNRPPALETDQEGAATRADAALLPGALPESPHGDDGGATPLDPPVVTESTRDRQRNYVSIFEE